MSSWCSRHVIASEADTEGSSPGRSIFLSRGSGSWHGLGQGWVGVRVGDVIINFFLALA